MYPPLPTPYTPRSLPRSLRRHGLLGLALPLMLACGSDATSTGVTADTGQDSTSPDDVAATIDVPTTPDAATLDVDLEPELPPIASDAVDIAQEDVPVIIAEDTLVVPPDTSPGDVADDTVLEEDVSDEDVPDEDVPDEDVPDEDVPDEDVPDEDVSGEDVQQEDVADEDTSACVPTGVEQCNGIDDDCDGLTDTGGGLALDTAAACGACDNDCTRCAAHCAEVTCSLGAAGEAGTCGCAACAPGWVNLDGGADCEMACTATANSEDTCDGRDDDCDGVTDEDVPACDAASCGGCGVTCSTMNGVPSCVARDPGAPCGIGNAVCAVAKCECSGPESCWWDVDGSAGTGCEYACYPTGDDVCDGLDNDCNGVIDDAIDPALGQPCAAEGRGRCGTGTGVTACAFGHVLCVGGDLITPGSLPETCNGVDDDCDGLTDDAPVDVGDVCGESDAPPCALGRVACVSGSPSCVGAVLPSSETCNGRDDDCDGVTDDDAAGMGVPCNVPKTIPGVESPCKAGSLACVAGVAVCIGSVGPSGGTDACGVDSNCDGVLTGQPNFETDVHHCDACGNDCSALGVHARWICVGGECVNTGCMPNYYDLDANGSCEYACIYRGPQEACNGKDDDCDGVIDEGLITPTPAAVCGVAAGVTAPECTTDVSVTCSGGAWRCTFPAGVCTNGCSGDDEICDALDNDCDGTLNENTPGYGKPCASDDGLAQGHGLCRTTGFRVCSGPNATECDAEKANCATLPGGCTEQCDGLDNDCDGSTDEPYNAKGSNAANFVRPVVTKIAANRWMFTYEASRPSATSTTPGTGNGFWTTAPTGVTAGKTRACSAPSKIPWTSVTPTEVAQTCLALGGTECTRQDFTTACQAGHPCLFGYNPRGAQCTSTHSSTKFCNLGSTFDSSIAVAGDQDAILHTASTQLQNCWADWSILQGNTSSTNRIYDITGNVWELVKDGSRWVAMGGSYLTRSVDGARCLASFAAVQTSYATIDTGFRCCFSSDPGL